MLTLHELGPLCDPFPDDLSRFIRVRSYARWIEAQQRRETWPETVLRYVNFLIKTANNSARKFNGHNGASVLSKDEAKAIFYAIHNLHVMPSMRLLWSAGPAAEQNNICAYNCSYHDITCIQSFVETLYILMCGTGVGAGITEEDIAKLPRINHQKSKHRLPVHVVADSREGWAEALRIGMEEWFDGYDCNFDYSLVRPAGARLRTMGGQASGPEPLRRLLEFTRSRILARQSRRLRQMDAGDIINMIGECVVAGGVRRSSEILLLSPDDREMRAAKHGAYWNTNPYRRMANNSLCFTEKPTTNDFMELWTEIITGRSGEPGIFNQSNSRTTSPRRATWRTFGTNPCVTGDVLVSTLSGPRTFKELADAGQDVLVHSLDLETRRPSVRLMRHPHKTQINVPVLQVIFDSGLSLRLTYDHQLISFRGNKVAARDLKVGQSIRAFSLSLTDRKGDPYRAISGWNRELNQNQDVLEHQAVWECFNGPLPEGYVIHHRNGIKNDNRIENLESMIEYQHQSEHYAQRLLSGFHQPLIAPEKLEQLQAAYNHKVLAIIPADNADVYNGCVDDFHTYVILDPEPEREGFLTGIYSANCGEIVLRGGHAEGGGQFCNLSEVVVRTNDFVTGYGSELSLCDKIKVASVIGTIQSALTDFPYLRPGWKKNCEEERLLGVSMTGIADYGDIDPLNLITLRDLAVATNRVTAPRLGISQSAAVTCVKPSGTVSRLVGASSGLHTRWSKFMIMHIRIAATDPLLGFFKSQGAPCYPEAGFTPQTANTWVIAFPVKSPEGAITRHDLTALQQLDRWKVLKLNFTEHNPSASIYVNEDEWVGVLNWVWLNWDIIGGLSFFPSDDHVFDEGRMPPYMEIDEAEYRRRKAAFPKIDWALLDHYEEEDNTVGGANGCEGVTCAI